MWKVIIAHDEKLICRLIEALVDWEKLNMRIAGKAENGLEALQMVRELRPHLLITDIRMPGCDGLDLIRQARELSPDIEIVIISGSGSTSSATCWTAGGSLPRRSWPKIISSTSKAAVFRPSF